MVSFLVIIGCLCMVVVGAIYALTLFILIFGLGVHKVTWIWNTFGLMFGVVNLIVGSSDQEYTVTTKN